MDSLPADDAVGPSSLSLVSSSRSLPLSSPGPQSSARLPHSPRAVTHKRREDSTPKRKNLQACDRCRRKKTKCEPLEGTNRDLCQSCHGASIQCTFELPLTASRSKRIKRGIGQLQSLNLRASEEVHEYDELGRDDARSIGSRHVTPSNDGPPMVSIARPKPPSVYREGPTSISYILHSMPTIALSDLAEYDSHSGYAIHSLPGDSGDGWIEVLNDRSDIAAASSPPMNVIEALQSESWTEVVSRLVETFLVNITPLIPIISRDDMREAEQTLIHVMAAVAAARRNCPKEIFETLRYIVRREMAENDVLIHPTRQHVQILLTLCLVDELALQPGNAAPVNVARARLSAAILMAQDLGMDRATRSSVDGRIWNCAVVIDQWNAARGGLRPIISVVSDTQSVSGSEDFFWQLVALTSILGRILNVVYGPEGISTARNEELNGIRDSLTHWKESLPVGLKVNGLWSGLQAGILHLLYTSIKFLLIRPFMRWSFICPTKFELNCDIPAWFDLLTCSRGSIEWAANQEELADLLFFGPYALSVVCLIQYHTWARRKEWDGVLLLDKARRDGVERWISRLPEGHLPLQRRQLGVISLLYAITQTHKSESTSFFSGPRGLNPTVGVLNRLPETSIGGITFLRDPSLPHGGVLVATQKAAREIKDLPPGTVIIGGQPESDETETMATIAPTFQVTPTTAGYLTGLLSEAAIAGDSRATIPTPDWEACVASIMFPNFEPVAAESS